MYYPWDIERFRKALDAGARDAFDGVPFTRGIVRVVPAASSGSVVEPAETRTMAGPEQIYGSPEDPSCLADVGSYPLTCPPKQLYQVKEAIIIGSSAVLGPDGALYCPDCVETQESLDRALSFNATNRQAFVLQRETSDSASAFYFWPGLPRHLDASVLFLPNLEPGNYGSFLFRVLPHILLAAQLRIAFDVIVASDRSHWLLDALRLAGLPPKPILLAEEVYGMTLRQVLFFNDFVIEGFFPISIAQTFKKWGAQIGAVEANNTLYVSRTLALMRTPRYRRLTNELTLENHARDRGCTIVYPEALALPDQIRLFASARRILGASGSGMLNAAFACEGARILDLESFHVTVRQHAKIYASTGKNYAFAFGQFEEGDPRDNTVRNWCVPEPIFNAGLNWLLADP